MKTALKTDNFIFIEHTPVEFCRYIDMLYPELSNYIPSKGVYSIFAKDSKQFVGTINTSGSGAYRKNKEWSGDYVKMARELIDIKKDKSPWSRGVCIGWNYATLSLWKRLGWGAKLQADGKIRAVAPDDDTKASLLNFRSCSRERYYQYCDVNISLRVEALDKPVLPVYEDVLNAD